MNTGSPSADQQIDNLKQRWHQLSDPDRAHALAEIRKSGLSNREIARRVQASEATIRRLLSILHAPAPDIAAARQAKISTNELVRRGKAEARKRTQRAKQKREREHARRAEQLAKVIITWLHEQNIAGPFAEQAVGQVRSKLARDEAAGIIPRMTPPAGFPIPTIIDRCKPPRSAEDDQIDDLGWHVTWLARWLICAVPDSYERYLALERALRHTQRGN